VEAYNKIVKNEFLAVEDISKADPNKISFDIGSPGLSMEDLRAQ
jgi:hypothetical protein